MKLRVSVDTRTWVTDPGDPDDKWDRDNTAQSIEGVSVYANDEDDRGYYSWGYPTPELDVNIGDTVYVVIIRYSDGDTFGNDEGQHAVADVFKDEIDALELQNWYEGWTTTEHMRYGGGKVVPFQESFKGKEYRIPWAGYFERYESVNIYECKVRG